MVQLGIPDQYSTGFTVLRDLGEDQGRQLVSALNEVPPLRSRRGLQENMASRVEGVGRTELVEVLDALTSLFSLRDDLNISTPELVEAISDAMDQSEPGDLGFADEEDRDSFEGILAEVLEIESFELTAKAISLGYEQDHIVHGVPRVLTDIRPIFNSDPEEVSVRGAMVMYTLKVEYHEGSEVRELFAALNAEQVDGLIQALERAKAKAESLKHALGDSPIRYVEAEYE